MNKNTENNYIEIWDLYVEKKDRWIMTWDEAMNEFNNNPECEVRLPTKEELSVIYYNKETIWGFIASYYWSSTENSNDYAYYENFNNGSKNTYTKKNSFNIRCVCK